MLFLIKNTSSRMTTVRISQTSTAQFHVADLVPKKSIAPGLEMTMRVVFYTEEGRTYRDQVVIHTDRGSITIPLKATVPAPEFSIPTVLDLGTVVAQPLTSEYFEIYNHGNLKGSFEFSWETNSNCTVTPKKGWIAANSSQKIKVRCIDSRCDKHERKWVLLRIIDTHIYIYTISSLYFATLTINRWK